MPVKRCHRSPRLIAFYLPQFHPIPENDAWWGKGFTEWTNVTKATPLFEGHYQPHLPTDLGFYDLRVRATRQEQIRLAKEYGIDGFCYYYYWFSGKRLLHQPLDDMLADAESDMPFCLCWANENWTRRWDAAESQILIEQRYEQGDALEFIKSITPFLADRRYIRKDGKLLLLVYRPQQIPDAARTVRVWREHCRQEGLGELYLCAALTHGNRDYAHLGFDAGVEFPPHNLDGISCVNDQILFNVPFRGRVMLFHEVAAAYLSRTYPGGDVHRGVFPAWDNTARTGSRATLVLNGTPANYEYWLACACRKTEEEYPGEERFVFINAWNEWAEGCHLEPDRRFGRAFLEATRRAKVGHTTLSGFTDTEIACPKGTQSLFADLRRVFAHHSLRLLRRAYEPLKPFVWRHPRLRRLLRRLLSWY